MIRHVVLFKLAPGVEPRDPRVEAAERLAEAVGERVTALRHWQFGKNVSDRPVAYDYAAIGLLPDLHSLEEYMEHPFHQEAIRAWREISTWVVADLIE